MEKGNGGRKKSGMKIKNFFSFHGSGCWTANWIPPISRGTKNQPFFSSKGDGKFSAESKNFFFFLFLRSNVELNQSSMKSSIHRQKGLFCLSTFAVCTERPIDSIPSRDTCLQTHLVRASGGGGGNEEHLVRSNWISWGLFLKERGENCCCCFTKRGASAKWVSISLGIKVKCLSAARENITR